jgi:hypothetical protein
MGPVGATLLGGACAMAVAAGGAYWFKDLRRLKKIEN